MNNQNKQIIPDLQAVAHCPDGTFLISDLLESLKPPVDNQESFINQLKILHLELKTGGYSRDHYRNKIEAFIENNTIIENREAAIIELFENGVDCNLLQPDGKGWQKGKLTMCFQFTPKESGCIPIEERLTETHHSSLDEIRRLSDFIQ